MSNFPYHLYLPNAAFADIFARAEVGYCPKPGQISPGIKVHNEQMEISPLATIKTIEGKTIFLTVEPSESMLAFVEEKMITVEHDRLTFEMIERQDGVLIIIRHGQIIGSRWLNIIPREGVPSELFPIEAAAN